MTCMLWQRAAVVGRGRVCSMRRSRHSGIWVWPMSCLGWPPRTRQRRPCSGGEGSGQRCKRWRCIWATDAANQVLHPTAAAIADPRSEASQPPRQVSLPFYSYPALILNSAARDGGGIWDGGPRPADGPTLSGNRAGQDGGGVRNSGQLYSSNTLVSDNSAGHDGGGRWNGGVLSADHAIVAGNTTGHDGGGLYNAR